MKKFLGIYAWSIAIVTGVVLGVCAVADLFAWINTSLGSTPAVVIAVLLFLAVTSALTAALPDDFRP